MTEVMKAWPIIDSEEFAEIGAVIFKDKQTIRIRGISKRSMLTLPRTISVDRDLAWAIGFYSAEGSKTYSGIGISNCEKDLVLKFKSIISKSLQINHNRWKAYVKTSNRDCVEVKKRWVEQLGVDWVVVNFASLARSDNIELRVNSTLFSAFFNLLAKKALVKISEDNELILAFLDGYEVGDGSVIQRNGCLHGIVITVKDNVMKDYLVDCFRRVYGYSAPVRKSKGANEIGVRGVHLMTRLILDGHFKSSNRQWKKLINCYKRKEYPRSHIRYWTALTRGECRINDLVKMTRRSHWAVRDAMIKDTTLGLVTLKRQHVDGYAAPYFNFYSLNDTGRELIKILDEESAHG